MNPALQHCVGREAVPPLAGIETQEVSALAHHRVVLLESTDEVVELVSTLLSHGWCVDNDAYLFPVKGGWLAYVGHHNDLDVYLPQECPLTSGCS